MNFLYRTFYKSLMQRQQSLSSMLMPRSAKGTRTTPKDAKFATFYSNIYSIELKEKNSTIYQYALFVEPQLPSDSSKLREKIIKSIYHDLKKNVGYVCFKGEMIWGRKNHPQVLTLISEFTKDSEKFKFEVLVKPVKEISLKDFIVQNPDRQVAICQILNINTKNLLKEKKMKELTMGCYFDPDKINDNISKTSGLNVWRGYKINIAPINNKFYIQIDPCSKVLREQSFLTTLELDRKKLSLDQINEKYKGSPILVKFGNMKIYKIEQIDFKQNPLCKFLHEKEGKDMSYLEYYKAKYGIIIKNEKQPLVKVVGGKQKLNEKELAINYVYLVPEMLTLTGLSDEQRSNFRVMKSIDEFTKISAQKGMNESQMLLEKLRRSQNLIFSIKEEPEKLDGYKYKEPVINLGEGRSTNVRNGSIQLRDRILDPVKFQNFIFCYSTGRDPTYDQEDADYALDQMKQASKTFGIKINEPYWIEVNGRKFADWAKELEAQKKKTPNISFDIVLFFVKPEEEPLYGELKKFVSLSFNCPSQVIRRRTLSRDQKGVLSCASKIILQMNVKVGHALWTIPNSHPFWTEKGKRIAVAGIANSKGKKGSTIGLVATTSQDLSSIFCDCKQIKSRDNLSAALFQGLFTQWLQQYFMKNQKNLPTDIIVYREGLNETQARSQFEAEVQGLLDTIEIVKKKTNQPNFSPRIVYLLVNKKPNSRIYQREGTGKKAQYFNPNPGSVIFEPLSADSAKQFHMASVSVREGRCSPVSYKVSYENYPSSLEALSEITYNQCYNYFNWNGSVRVPAVLQDANKLSKLFSQIGDELVTESKNSDLKNKAFFL